MCFVLFMPCVSLIMWWWTYVNFPVGHLKAFRKVSVHTLCQFLMGIVWVFVAEFYEFWSFKSLEMNPLGDVYLVSSISPKLNVLYCFRFWGSVGESFTWQCLEKLCDTHTSTCSNLLNFFLVLMSATMQELISSWYSICSFALFFFTIGGETPNR